MESENSFSITSSIIGLIQGIVVGGAITVGGVMGNSKTTMIIGLIVLLIMPIITGYYSFVNYLPIAILFLLLISQILMIMLSSSFRN